MAKGRPKKPGPRKPCGRLSPERLPPQHRDALTGQVVSRERMGHVYVMGPCFGPVKIGSALDVEARRETLQVGSPVRLIVHYSVAVEGSARSVEMAVHRRLQCKRGHGEWFSVSRQEAIEAIETELQGRTAA